MKSTSEFVNEHTLEHRTIYQSTCILDKNGNHVGSTAESTFSENHVLISHGIESKTLEFQIKICFTNTDKADKENKTLKKRFIYLFA